MKLNELFSLSGKTALVTGCSRGIGEAMAIALAEAGADIIGVSGTLQPGSYVEQEVKKAGRKFSTYTIDLGNREALYQSIAKIKAENPVIDILINNAGISMRAELKDASVDVIRQVMNINFFGAVYCTNYALNSIIERGGTIAAVSSIAGYRGLPGRSGYSASKFALQGWLEAIRTELLDSGVNVMWVCPGFTTSNIRNVALNKEGQPQGESPMDESSMMPADKCARLILRAIEKRKRTLVMTFTGKRTVWMNKLFPALTDKMVRKFFYKKEVLTK